MNEIARNKIKELFCSECAFLNKCAVDTDGCHVYSKAVELYKWTKEQTVSEAGRWFMEHAEDFIDDEGGTVMPYIEKECFERFKKVMEARL